MHLTKPYKIIPFLSDKTGQKSSENSTSRMFDTNSFVLIIRSKELIIS